MSGEIKQVEVRSITSNAEIEEQKSVQSKAFYEAEKARIECELAGAQLELQKAQLEDLRRRNKEAKEKEAVSQSRLEQQQLRDENEEDKRLQKQAGCNHKQGGEGIEGLFEGEDNNYAVNAEFNLLGRKTYRCTRCDKMWDQNHPDFKEVSRWPHKGQRPAIPVTFTVPGVNAPLPPGYTGRRGVAQVAGTVSQA